MIRVVEDNIVEMNVDAIVNAANNELLGGGGVDGAIHTAAGSKLDDACLKIGYCDTGDAVITRGFNLKAKYIIHTVGPIYYHNDKTTNEELLRSCYRKSLILAKENNIHSIAFPCISTGAYGYPLNDAAVVSIDEVKKWLNDTNYNIDVFFVCFRKEEFEIYNRIINCLS